MIIILVVIALFLFLITLGWDIIDIVIDKLTKSKTAELLPVYKVEEIEVEEIVMIGGVLNDYNKNKTYPISTAQFIENCLRYLKAVKQGRMMCSIDTVSQSGMSRTMRFFELSKSTSTNSYILNFYNLFDILGYQTISNSDYFRIHGCGMDMVFNTNYNIIFKLKSLGFITQKTAKSLAQKTPHIV